MKIYVSFNYWESDQAEGSCEPCKEVIYIGEDGMRFDEVLLRALSHFCTNYDLSALLFESVLSGFWIWSEDSVKDSVIYYLKKGENDNVQKKEETVQHTEEVL